MSSHAYKGKVGFLFYFFAVLPAIKALLLSVCFLHTTPCYVSKVPSLLLLMTSACAGCQIFCICATVRSKNVTQCKFFSLSTMFFSLASGVAAVMVMVGWCVGWMTTEILAIQ